MNTLFDNRFCLVCTTSLGPSSIVGRSLHSYNKRKGIYMEKYIIIPTFIGVT